MNDVFAPEAITAARRCRERKKTDGTELRDHCHIRFLSDIAARALTCSPEM
ncbi:hypothetical protein [Sphingopyxis indica]|uniref:hypothetical protein n=1 Tax=Sphingopyxis indica TaxID=436663 RepID=UPI001483451C|nr:hypothetical protein [Sphingopyxis indica]